MKETDLYAPVKSFLEKQGFQVKSEIASCDVVGHRNNDIPVIVELKIAFNLQLLFQAIARQSISDHVYIAFPLSVSGAKNSVWKRHRRDILKLCRLLGLGLLTVKFYKSRAPFVEAHLDPLPYQPRKNKRKQNMLLREFQHRVGDHNEGGSSRRPIVTAYRQEVLLCAHQIAISGPSNLSSLRKSTGLQDIGRIFQKDVYGWFIRTSRATYDLSPKGHQALSDFQDVIDDLVTGDAGM